MKRGSVGRRPAAETAAATVSGAGPTAKASAARCASASSLSSRSARSRSDLTVLENASTASRSSGDRARRPAPMASSKSPDRRATTAYAAATSCGTPENRERNARSRCACDPVRHHAVTPSRKARTSSGVWVTSSADFFDGFQNTCVAALRDPSIRAPLTHIGVRLWDQDARRDTPDKCRKSEQ